jgi:transcriptional regulator with GAF, ATPase, and Fis domain
MRLKSLKGKLVISVFAFVIGSGLIISLMETHRFSKKLHEDAIIQGEYLAKALALEATDKILINDLIALQNLLNHQLKSNPSIAYLFVIKDDQILAHTFADGIPINLVDVNAPQDNDQGNFKRIETDEAEYYHDIAWPIFSGKAGILRIGFSEKPHKAKVAELWFQMIAFTLGILLLAILASFLFIKRITKPLSALTEAAEKVNETNLELTLTVSTEGYDEVGRLTSSFNKMLRRISEYTRRIEKNSLELKRAQRQTTNSFEIIHKIWTQDNLKDVCTYLTLKLREIVACSELAFLIFNSTREMLFIFTEGEIKTAGKDAADSAIPILSHLESFTYLNAKSFSLALIPQAFVSAMQIATFPIQFENQNVGALLVGCPGDCNCSTKEQDVVGLILNHSAGAIKRSASREEEMRNIQRRIDRTTEYCGIVGKDPKMHSIYKLIEDIAPTETTVLIQGESGTGKELVASAIHQKSLRRDKPFIVINCSAYPATLLESELFGHEKGAFTGAVRQKAGRFEQAHGGTVFLDEIGEIPSASQIKLLRVLQTQKFERVGGEQTLAVDIRIMAATNKDLLQEVKTGHFREDLYYRLNVIPVHLPPLRKRGNDIPLQARYFLRRFAAEQGKAIAEFSSEAMRMLLNYSWPGNVRELENCIEHAVVLAHGKRIEANDLPGALEKDTFYETIDNAGTGTITEIEARLLKEVLDECDWNKKEAARRLGISRNTLYRKLKKYQITPPTLH